MGALGEEFDFKRLYRAGLEAAVSGLELCKGLVESEDRSTRIFALKKIVDLSDIAITFSSLLGEPIEIQTVRVDPGDENILSRRARLDE